MLLMNVQVGQIVYVGKDAQIQLTDVNKVINGVKLQATIKGTKTPAVWVSVDSRYKLMKNVFIKPVSLNYTRVVEGCTLGFFAPSNIKIQGEWMRRKEERAIPQYTALTTGELIRHVHAVGTDTPLEKELVTRLEQYYYAKN